MHWHRFWSSVDLTGNQTRAAKSRSECRFWSSVDLTGNQTICLLELPRGLFWSSVDLTGNQTPRRITDNIGRFGAVSI